MPFLSPEFQTQLAVIATISASHMSLPNHWLPYSLISRAQKWSLRKTLVLTFLGALTHVSVTILVMLAISEVSSTLISDSVYRFASSSILLLFGLYYLSTHFSRRPRTSCCETNHALLPQTATEQGAKVGEVTAAGSLVLLSALSPCVGSMPVLLVILRPPIEWGKVAVCWAVLLATAAAVMMALVTVSYFGVGKLHIVGIRKYERLVIGGGLVILAGLTFWTFANHGMHQHAGVMKEGVGVGMGEHVESGHGHGHMGAHGHAHDEIMHGAAGHDVPGRAMEKNLKEAMREGKRVEREGNVGNSEVVTS